MSRSFVLREPVPDVSSGAPSLTDSTLLDTGTRSGRESTAAPGAGAGVRGRASAADGGSARRVVAVLFDGSSAERANAAEELAQVWSNQREVGGVRRFDVQLRPVVAGANGAGAADPYGLELRLPRIGADAAVLVAPRRRGSRGLIPGPVVQGVPVGIVQADAPDHLPATEPGVSADPAAPWVVAAMAKNVFLDATESWSSRLGATHPTVDLRADRVRRDDLLDGLQAGPGVVLYAGHGSPRGWAGYQALRVDHFRTARSWTGHGPDTELDVGTGAPRPELSGTPRPIGLMMAFACKTLARHRGRWPFGSQLVERGVAGAYLAPAQAVYTAEAERLADIVVDLLVELRTGSEARQGIATVADLMRLTEERTAREVSARRAWATFRLIGDPQTPLV